MKSVLKVAGFWAMIILSVAFSVGLWTIQRYLSSDSGSWQWFSIISAPLIVSGAAICMRYDWWPGPSLVFLGSAAFAAPFISYWDGGDWLNHVFAVAFSIPPAVILAAAIKNIGEDIFWSIRRRFPHLFHKKSAS